MHLLRLLADMGMAATSILRPNYTKGALIGVRARRGWEGCSPPDSGKTIIFRAKAKFSGRSQQRKMKKYCFVFI